MLFGCCTNSQNAPLIKAMGYDFIEIEGAELAAEQPESVFTPVRERLQAAGLPVRGFNKFFTAGIAFIGPNVDTIRNRRYVEVSVARGAALGGANVGWGSAASRNIPEGFPRGKALEQFMEALAFVADVAQQHGMNVLVESLARQMTNFILTMQEATDIARAVGRPNVHVVADTYHMLHNDDALENLAVAGPDLYHVHLTDLDRRAPGTNPAEQPLYAATFRILRQMGYDGSVSIEPNFTDFEPEARRALAFLKETYAEANCLVGAR